MALSDEIYKILDEFGTATKEDLQQSLRDKGVTFGGNDSKLSTKINFVIQQKGDAIVFKLNMPEYGEAVDTGRGKGLTPPPIAPIIAWIKRKGIKPSPNEAREKKVKSLKNRVVKKAVKQLNRETAIKGMAIAISKNIGKNGTIKRFNHSGSHFYSEVVNDGRLSKLKQDLAKVLKSEIEIEIIDLTKLR